MQGEYSLWRFALLLIVKKKLMHFIPEEYWTLDARSMLKVRKSRLWQVSTGKIRKNDHSFERRDGSDCP